MFMVENIYKSDNYTKKLKINQANIFYNYTLGFDLISVDLIKTARNLLKSETCKFIFFSDYKFSYIDEKGKIKIKSITPQGRINDFTWYIENEKDLPKEIIADLVYSYQMAFQESKLYVSSEPYLRAFLPPIILENQLEKIVLFTSVKIFADGIVILSFQLDLNCDKGISENTFLTDIINLSDKYFSTIWVDHRIQTYDAEILLKNAYEDTFSIAGQKIGGRKFKKSIHKLRNEARERVINSFEKEGLLFEFKNESWILHKIANSENDKNWKSTFTLCHSIYSNAIRKLIVPLKQEKNILFTQYIWVGRPSVSLMRFEEQPENKKEFFKCFSGSIKKFLIRTNINKNQTNRIKLPPDLRLFNDYCLHGSRGILLWTWLKVKKSPKNAWNDPSTQSNICSNQARAEQLEHYNMIITRACAWAHNPLTEKHLINAYRQLSNVEQLIHNCSLSGEISAAIAFFIKAFGTEGLVQPAKNAAKFYLDEMRYQSDKVKKRSNDWLTFVFGIVGVTSFADFVVSPIIQNILPTFSEMIIHFISFGISVVLIFFIALFINFSNNNNQ